MKKIYNTKKLYHDLYNKKILGHDWGVTLEKLLSVTWRNNRQMFWIRERDSVIQMVENVSELPEDVMECHCTYEL